MTWRDFGELMGTAKKYSAVGLAASGIWVTEKLIDEPVLKYSALLEDLETAPTVPSDLQHLEAAPSDKKVHVILQWDMGNQTGEVEKRSQYKS